MNLNWIQELRNIFSIWFAFVSSCIQYFSEKENCWDISRCSWSPDKSWTITISLYEVNRRASHFVIDGTLSFAVQSVALVQPRRCNESVLSWVSVALGLSPLDRIDLDLKKEKERNEKRNIAISNLTVVFKINGNPISTYCFQFTFYDESMKGWYF